MLEKFPVQVVTIRGDYVLIHCEVLRSQCYRSTVCLRVLAVKGWQCFAAVGFRRLVVLRVYGLVIYVRWRATLRNSLMDFHLDVCVLAYVYS